MADSDTSAFIGNFKKNQSGSAAWRPTASRNHCHRTVHTEIRAVRFVRTSTTTGTALWCPSRGAGPYVHSTTGQTHRTPVHARLVGLGQCCDPSDPWEAFVRNAPVRWAKEVDDPFGNPLSWREERRKPCCIRSSTCVRACMHTICTACVCCTSLHACAPLPTSHIAGPAHTWTKHYQVHRGTLHSHPPAGVPLEQAVLAGAESFRHH